MSYLNVPRLTFSGQFQADPSTVNNDPTHFNNETFETKYQNYGQGQENGWWNPDGTGNWRFIGCKITSVTYQDGTSTDNPLLDPIIGMSVMDTDARTAGKIVDLDTQQQMVSELWGFIVRIVSNEGNTLVKGDYEVAAFTNIWFSRSVDKTADGAAAASYQSIIKNIDWNFGIVNSRYLNELKAVSAKQLSIQFTVDRYNGDNTSAGFTLGRIAGSIGPSSSIEPKHFVLGRQLFPLGKTYNYATALVDEKLKQVVLDFGNALQFNTGGVVKSIVDLHLVIDTNSGKSEGYVDIGKIDYASPDWYMGTSGIFTFPLSDEQLNLATKYPLAITQIITSPKNVFTLETTRTSTAIYAESVDYVCADQFVFRLDPDDNCKVNFHATHLGKALPNAIIQLQDDTKKLLASPPPPVVPVIGVPPILYFSGKKPVEITTDANGKARLEFIAPDPGNPRVYIDGQVYGISYTLSTQKFAKDCNQSNFISLLIYSGAPATEIVLDWDSFIQPIMQQYANLYPLMSKGIFNLADRAVFENNAQILHLVFSKDPEDPNYMPATRDLSKYKKTVILNYLQSIIDNTATENKA
ncbi:hypothetical protein OIU80_16830 [Flavobacterium sp. LS1R47]|uniref:Uncharacterized protein n=1 Tax=Flavobacterium frigoritolerans TaxID=2987686 RepID=A0A9X3HM65_9FLAO|nr:hypothetical protein [Flavobacterium frigoritolerans]MCV9933950.1 hypothetical protein [Flavobacterium frigoritolerans]